MKPCQRRHIRWGEATDEPAREYARPTKNDVAPDGAGNSGRGVSTKRARLRRYEFSRNIFPQPNRNAVESFSPVLDDAVGLRWVGWELENNPEGVAAVRRGF